MSVFGEKKGKGNCSFCSEEINIMNGGGKKKLPDIQEVLLVGPKRSQGLARRKE